VVAKHPGDFGTHSSGYAFKCAPHQGQYSISIWDVPPSWTRRPKRLSRKRPTRASGHSEGEACLSHDQLSWAAMDLQQANLSRLSVTVY
jgi:hypothetical protein